MPELTGDDAVEIWLSAFKFFIGPQQQHYFKAHDYAYKAVREAEEAMTRLRKEYEADENKPADNP